MSWRKLFFKSGTIISLDKDNVIIGYGDRAWYSHPPLNSKPSFYFPDFFLQNSTPWFQHQYIERISLQSLIAMVPTPRNYDPHTWDVQGERCFAEQFDELMRVFETGSLVKAVPYLFYFSDNLFSLANSLRHLLTHCFDHHSFIYGFWDDSQGILGGTPEQLFSLMPNGTLRSAAIAGTAPSDIAETLLEDKKLQKEHDIVIQGIQEALSPFSDVFIGETQVLSLSHLSHLHTPIEAKISKSVQIESLITALHPTPALGAFPKQSGDQWLWNLEQLLPRGRYGAPVGIKEGDFFTSYVAIRNVQWNAQGSKIGVGCGVLNNSDFKKEREELSLKFRAICSMLNM